IAQTKMLLDFMQSEYQKGNYVIVGGDFNQSFPNALHVYPIKDSNAWTPGILDENDLPSGWKYVYDNSSPTCRLLNKPYNPADTTTQYYGIDGFILSPNVQITGVQTYNANFEYSDHNPVVMEVQLINQTQQQYPSAPPPQIDLQPQVQPETQNPAAIQPTVTEQGQETPVANAPVNLP
ncbi:MAG: hypothetical protein GX786_01625, partial [Clostridiales bacterium]|nr:hypothetical protein [Clostridiales bacterium]